MDQLGALPDPLRARCERALDSAVVATRRADGGYTPAERWVVALADGSSAFVKAATNDDTALWLRTERDHYGCLELACMPRVLAWCEDGAYPALMLEDLSTAHWPPPWGPGHVEAVRVMLATMHATVAPPALPSMLVHAPILGGWARVAEAPSEFLGLGMASPAWLDAALPVLIRGEASISLEGDRVCHMDVRSDNLCLAERGGMLVDWNFACRGNPTVDTAFWLPTLAFEAGVAPEAILPDAPEAAALVSGYLAEGAGKPKIPQAPRVRALQRRGLDQALPWAVRALGLPPLDGPEAPGG